MLQVIFINLHYQQIVMEKIDLLYGYYYLNNFK